MPEPPSDPKERNGSAGIVVRLPDASGLLLGREVESRQEVARMLEEYLNNSARISCT
jgi:hypothetical protein